MTEITKEISIRQFCGSLVGRIYLWRSSETREQDEIAPPSALKPTPPGRLLVSRIINQGRFDWGPFSAFEDGSFEVERVGLTQWFRNFSELERSVKKAAVSRVRAERGHSRSYRVENYRRSLGRRDSRNNAGYKFQRCVRKNEEQSAHRQLLFRKEGAGRKKQDELPTLSFPCLDSGKRKGEGDRLDSLGPSQLSRSLRGLQTTSCSTPPWCGSVAHSGAATSDK